METLPEEAQKAAKKVQFVAVKRIIFERRERLGEDMTVGLKLQLRNWLNEEIRSEHPWLIRKSEMES